MRLTRFLALIADWRGWLSLVATAVWTLSLNHQLCGRAPSLSEELIGSMDRTSLLKNESGRIAIAVPLQTSGVIPLVFGVCQHLSFSGRQLGIPSFFASNNVCGRKRSLS